MGKINGFIILEISYIYFNYKKNTMTKVNLIDNGPLVVVGEHTITHPDGSQEVKPARASYCRCEKSANMPFCDGAHKG